MTGQVRRKCEDASMLEEFMKNSKQLKNTDADNDSSDSEGEIHHKTKLDAKFANTPMPSFYTKIPGMTGSSSKDAKLVILDNIIPYLKENTFEPFEYSISVNDSEFENIASFINVGDDIDIENPYFNAPRSNRQKLICTLKDFETCCQTLKALFINANNKLPMNDSNDESDEEISMRISVHPIKMQINHLKVLLKRLRKLCLPLDIPTAIKSDIINAPYLPGKLWNIKESNLKFFKNRIFIKGISSKPGPSFSVKCNTFHRSHKKGKFSGKIRPKSSKK